MRSNWPQEVREAFAAAKHMIMSRLSRCWRFKEQQQMELQDARGGSISCRLSPKLQMLCKALVRFDAHGLLLKLHAASVCSLMTSAQQAVARLLICASQPIWQGSHLRRSSILSRRAPLLAPR